jgi:hypothetical protein
MSRPIHLIAEYVGDEQIAVHVGNNKEPHCVIDGVSIDRLDKKKIEEYVRGCDWTDRGAPGYITPHLRCDEFLKS